MYFMPYRLNRQNALELCSLVACLITLVLGQYLPLNRYPLFQRAGFGEADCPEAEDFFDNMVSFPFHQWMPEDQFLTIVEATLETIEALK